jgi:hypothetical protein
MKAKEPQAVAARNSLAVDREFSTLSHFMGQELTATVPGRDPIAASEFAALNLLRSFSSQEILFITSPIHVWVKLKGGAVKAFDVWVKHPEGGRVEPSWSVQSYRAMST